MSKILGTKKVLEVLTKKLEESKQAEINHKDERNTLGEFHSHGQSLAYDYAIFLINLYSIEVE